MSGGGSLALPSRMLKVRTGEGQEDISDGRCEQQCGRGTNLVHCGSDQSWELLGGRMGREVEPWQGGKEEPEPWDSGLPEVDHDPGCTSGGRASSCVALETENKQTLPAPAPFSEDRSE